MSGKQLPDDVTNIASDETKTFPKLLMTIKKSAIFIAIVFGVLIFIYFAMRPILIFSVSSNTLLLGGAGALLLIDFKAAVKIARSDEYPNIASKLVALTFYLLGGLLLSAAVLGFMTGVLASIHYSYGLMIAPERNPTYAGLVTSVFVLVVGGLLFLFRLHARACYGFVELFVGLFVAYAQVQNLKKDAYIFEPTIAMSLLTASVYLIVRAMDNMNEGQKTDKLLKFWRKFRINSNI